MQRSISIQSTTTGLDAGKKKTKTLGYINPNAAPYQVQNAVTKYTALSTNSYSSATVNDKYELNEIRVKQEIAIEVDTEENKVYISDLNGSTYLWYTTTANWTITDSTWTYSKDSEWEDNKKVHTIPNLANVKAIIVGSNENASYTAGFLMWIPNGE